MLSDQYSLLCMVDDPGSHRVQSRTRECLDWTPKQIKPWDANKTCAAPCPETNKQWQRRTQISVHWNLRRAVSISIQVLLGKLFNNLLMSTTTCHLTKATIRRAKRCSQHLQPIKWGHVTSWLMVSKRTHIPSYKCRLSSTITSATWTGDSLFQNISAFEHLVVLQKE